ncbi:MAG: tryptophan-rich sensory protein, partial [Clostridia bacterium]|nr:tryptophan-rich sensory protein [Clostridia bacterium]
MKNNKKTLIIALAIPLLVGGLAALLSGGMDSFSALNKPPLSPPGWLFPSVWTILYLAMGFASYLVATA